MRSLRYDSNAPFMLALLIAAVAHICLALGVGSLLPAAIHFKPIDILQVKLGMEDAEEGLITQHLSEPVARAVSRQFSSTKSGGDQLSERAASKLDKSFGKANIPQQFVRERDQTIKPIEGRGSELGNAKQTKIERITAYGQTLSLWMQRFKIYSEEARAQELEGTAMVRIRIDRTGNILYVSLRQKTGHALLDRAVMDMVDRANPVPPVPDDYPVDDPFLEFLIPISFKLAK